MSAALLVLLFTCLGLLLDSVLDTSVGSWDLDVARDLESSRTALLDTLTGAGTMFSNTAVVAVLSVVGAVVVRLTTHSWLAAAVVAVAVGGEKLIYFVVTLLVDRPRPPVSTVGFVHATTSFPSGHVGAAIALYGSLALVLGWATGASRAIRVALLVVPALIAAVVAYCRMYRGVHYPTDVLAGGALGATWLAIVWSVLYPGDEHDPSPTTATSPRATVR